MHREEVLINERGDWPRHEGDIVGRQGSEEKQGRYRDRSGRIRGVVVAISGGVAGGGVLGDLAGVLGASFPLISVGLIAIEPTQLNLNPFALSLSKGPLSEGPRQACGERSNLPTRNY